MAILGKNSILQANSSKWINVKVMTPFLLEDIARGILLAPRGYIAVMNILLVKSIG